MLHSFYMLYLFYMVNYLKYPYAPWSENGWHIRFPPFAAFVGDANRLDLAPAEIGNERQRLACRVDNNHCGVAIRTDCRKRSDFLVGAGNGNFRTERVQVAKRPERIVRLARSPFCGIEERAVHTRTATRVVDRRKVYRRALKPNYRIRQERGLLRSSDAMCRKPFRKVDGDVLKPRLVQLAPRMVRLLLNLPPRTVAMEREEVRRAVVFPDVCQEIVKAPHVVRGALGLPVGAERLEAAAAVCAELEVRELRLQVFLRRSVEVEVLPERAAPHGVRLGRLLAVRLVPYLPVVDLPLKSVRPPLRVVAHDPFADLGPFEVVLGREDLARAELCCVVLDGHPEPEVRSDAVGDKGVQQVVGKSEGIRIGIRRVGVEVFEEIRYVYVYALPGHGAADVVKAGIGNVRVLEALKQLVVPAYERRLAYAMHRLDLLRRPREVNGNCDARNAARERVPVLFAALPRPQERIERRLGRPRLARRNDKPTAMRW